MSKVVYLILYVLTSSYVGVYTFTVEERKNIEEYLKPFVTECAQKHGLTLEKIIAEHNAGHRTEDLNFCYSACLLKTLNVINADGMFNADTAMNVIKKYDNDQDYAILVQKAKNCAVVNDQSVSDGEAGCERAKLVMTCLRDQGVEILY